MLKLCSLSCILLLLNGSYSLVMTSTSFWTSGTCPYAQRTWIGLIEKSVPFELKKVDLTNKAEDFVHEYHKVHPDPDSRPKVPVLQHDGFSIIESAVVAEYLEDKFKGQGTQLLPHQAEDRAYIRLFIDLFQNTVGSMSFKILSADTDEERATKVQELMDHMETINDYIEWHGKKTGPFFMGDQFTNAEVMCAPFVQRLIPTVKYFCSKDPLELAKQDELPRLVDWIEAVLSRPSVVESGQSEEAIVEGMKTLIERMKASAANK